MYSVAHFWRLATTIATPFLLPDRLPPPRLNSTTSKFPEAAKTSKLLVLLGLYQDWNENDGFFEQVRNADFSNIHASLNPAFKKQNRNEAHFLKNINLKYLLK